MTEQQDIARGLATLQESIDKLKVRLSDLEGDTARNDARRAMNRVVLVEDDLIAIKGVLPKVKKLAKGHEEEIDVIKNKLHGAYRRLDVLDEATEDWESEDHFALVRRVYALEQQKVLDEALTDDEKCLLAMYRKLRSVEAPDPPMRIVVSGDGQMEMGLE